jgi:hypothetical protein
VFDVATRVDLLAFEEPEFYDRLRAGADPPANSDEASAD